MFELTGEIIDEILFCMEDRRGEYVINTRTGAVRLAENDLADEETHIPSWSSARGFKLMETFTARQKSTEARQRLSSALNRGKGVFRAFKDALTAFPEIEKRWLLFKNEELKKAIQVWYEALSQEQRIGKIGAEPEDTSELIYEDFQFETTNTADTITITVRNTHETYAGKIAARERDGVFFVEEFIIEDNFRGLGLGTFLLERLLGRTRRKPVIIDLPAESDVFSKTLLREGFTVATTRYRRTDAE